MQRGLHRRKVVALHAVPCSPWHPLLLLQSFHLCLQFLLGYVRITSERAQAISGVVYPHEDKVQRLVTAIRTTAKM